MRFITQIHRQDVDATQSEQATAENRKKAIKVACGRAREMGWTPLGLDEYREFDRGYNSLAKVTIVCKPVDVLDE